jgi:hypothetical protein
VTVASDLYQDEPTEAVSLSGSQRFYHRALHVFFGHPIRFLVPALAITLFGVYSGTSQVSEFRSVGAISVSSQTFLGSLSDSPTNDFGFETASTRTARQFNELMQTDGFTTSVVSNAGLANQLDSGRITIASVRSTVYAVAAGDSLMHIIAVSKSPASSQALADSAIKTFKTWVIDAEVSASDAAETFFDEQLTTYKAEVDTANDALTQYVIDNPAPADTRDARDTAEQLEIERLNGQLTRAQERFDSAVDKREASRQKTRESKADIGQRLKIVDAPGVPALPEAGLKQLLTTVILFGVLGTLVSLGAVAIACAIDRSIRSIADLEFLGPPVVAVVPRSKGMKVDHRHVQAVEQPRETPRQRAVAAGSR